MHFTSLLIFFINPLKVFPGPISTKKAVTAAAQACSEAGAKRCVSLKVSGPFHSELLKGAGEKLEKELYSIKLNKPSIPSVTRATLPVNIPFPPY